MGSIVLAAKITHVPSIYLSEQPGPTQGIRQNAIDGLRELGRRAHERGVDTYVVFDVHWVVSQGFHVNGNERHGGDFTSDELPHFIHDLAYDYPGDPELAARVGEAGNAAGLKTRVHRGLAGLPVAYGTLIPMRHMNPEGDVRVLPVACNAYATMEEHRAFGAAVAEAVGASDRRAALLASGSLSHQFWPNSKSEAGLNEVNTTFNRLVDELVLDLWQQGRMKEFVELLPDYAERCYGEVGMADTAMLFGALGWDGYQGRGEVLGHYFGSSGTGQCNVELSVEGVA